MCIRDRALGCYVGLNSTGVVAVSVVFTPVSYTHLDVYKRQRVMLLANMPDHGLANGSLGTVLEAGVDCVTVDFDDCEYPVEVSEKERCV